MNKVILKKLGFYASVATGICLVISIFGLFVLHQIGYPMNAMMPTALTAVLYGVFAYGVLACICFVLSSPKPPRVGKHRKIFSQDKTPNTAHVIHGCSVDGMSAN